MCLQPPTHHSSMLSNEIMDGMSCCSIWFNDRIWLASVATKHMLTSHHSSLCAGAGRGWVIVGKNGGRGGGGVRVERGSSAVYTCLQSGMVRALQGCSLLLAVGHLLALASKVLLHIYELFLNSDQDNAPLIKLLLQLVILVLGFLQVTICTEHYTFNQNHRTFKALFW